MAALKTLIAWLSLLFHLLLSLVLLGLAILALISGAHTLRLEMLPWSGSTLAYTLLAGGLIGLTSIVLAAIDRVRALFLLWSLAVAVLVTKWLFFSSYRFAPGQWNTGAYLVLACWFSAVGALILFLSKPSPGPRKYKVK